MAKINFKDISTSGFDEDLLTTATSGERVINFGHLTTTGNLANSIFADANDVAIRNFAPIETSGLGAPGIFVQGDDAHIANYGSVVTHAISMIPIRESTAMSSSPKVSSPRGIDSILPITAAFTLTANPRPA
jgi:hypothetical protein